MKSGMKSENEVRQAYEYLKDINVLDKLYSFKYDLIFNVHHLSSFIRNINKCGIDNFIIKYNKEDYNYSTGSISFNFYVYQYHQIY